MELHSYAKTRTNRKWTIDQKRKLVENRITLDVLFNKKAFNLADSWKKLVKVSDMESFDVLFVRKQWTNILTKYKNLVQRHATNNYIDNETLNLLTAEWEFFDKIHHWVKYKEKIQHDYNSIIIDEIENETLNQSICGSSISYITCNQKESTDDEDTITGHNINPVLHLSKKNLVIEKQNKNIVVVIDQEKNLPGPSPKEEPKKINLLTKKIISKNIDKTKLKKNRKLEKKFARLKRKYSKEIKSNKKIATKLDGFCKIFGQIVKKEYPDIDVSYIFEENFDSSDSFTDTD